MFPMGASSDSKLGSSVSIHLPESLQEPEKVTEVLLKLREVAGVYTAMGRHDAANDLDLPEDRIGDIWLFGDGAVFGKSPNEHTLSDVETLRSTGGLDEAEVPVILNFQPTKAYKRLLSRGKARNYHLFQVLVNGHDPEFEELCPQVREW